MSTCIGSNFANSYQNYTGFCQIFKQCLKFKKKKCAPNYLNKL